MTSNNSFWAQMQIANQISSLNKKTNMFRVAAVLVFFLACASTYGASFNCDLAKTRVERTICLNPKLSNADDELAKSYSTVKSLAKNQTQLTASQSEWLKRRDKCRSDACLTVEYAARKAFVDAWPEYESNTFPRDDEAQCTDTDRPACWPEGSAMYSLLTQQTVLVERSGQMTKMHDALVELVSTSSPDDDGDQDSDVTDALKSQQKAWMSYVPEECGLVGTLSRAGGQWPLVWTIQCELTLTEARFRSIDSAVQCIQSTPAKDRPAELASCLDQLAPLAGTPRS